VFLLVHLILLDTNSARLLWKRIPKAFKDDKIPENKQLIETWAIGKALTKNEYQNLFTLLEKDSIGLN
jgi:hypothetical protein